MRVKYLSQCLEHGMCSVFKTRGKERKGRRIDVKKGEREEKNERWEGRKESQYVGGFERFGLKIYILEPFAYKPKT